MQQQHNETTKAGHAVIWSWSYIWAIYLLKQLYLAQFRQVEAKTKCDRDRLKWLYQPRGAEDRGNPMVLLSVISHLIFFFFYEVSSKGVDASSYSLIKQEEEV